MRKIERRRTARSWKDYAVNNTLQIIMTDLNGLIFEFEGIEIISRLYDLAYDDGIYGLNSTYDINEAVKKFLKHTGERSLYESFFRTTLTNLYDKAYLHGNQLGDVDN